MWNLYNRKALDNTFPADVDALLNRTSASVVGKKKILLQIVILEINYLWLVAQMKSLYFNLKKHCIFIAIYAR